MNIFSTAARLRFSLWASLAVGLVGTGTLAPSPIHDATTALTGLGEPALDLCTETLFTGMPTIAASAMPMVDEQLTSLACAGGRCVDPESLSSQPSAGEDAGDTLPETGDEIPVLASLAPLPDVPGLDDPDVTDDPHWIMAGPRAGKGGAGQGRNGGGSGAEEFVLLPGTGGFNAPPTNSGGSEGANGTGGDGSGGSPGGRFVGGSGGGGSGSGGFGGGGGGGGGGGSSGGGGGSSGGDDDDDDDGREHKFPVQRLAVFGDAPAEVPAPATITLLGLGLVALARSKR